MNPLTDGHQQINEHIRNVKHGDFSDADLRDEDELPELPQEHQVMNTFLRGSFHGTARTGATDTNKQPKVNQKVNKLIRRLSGKGS
jgi:hypothetical protein